MSQARRHTRPRPAEPLPPRMLKLLREARALAVLAAALFLAVMLMSHSSNDGGFFTTGIEGARPSNLAGSLGAWVSDLLLGLLGYSAWWLVALAVSYAVWVFRHLEEEPLASRRHLWVALGGFALLILASSALEHLRLWSLADLPHGAGGILGQGLGGLAMSLTGFTGGTLLLLTGMGIGFSLYTGTSWLRIAETVGERLERAWWSAIIYIQRKRDERIGQAALQKREEVVAEEKKKLEIAKPVRIEPVVKEVPKSPRLEAEKQSPLFRELPDSPLPPLHLLDEAAQAAVEPVGKEALEFTSLMIERKLKEFGVEVKVVTASPGPVITRYEIEPAVGVKGSQIVNLSKDLARTLSVVSIRVVEAIPGKHTMGLEIPNPNRQTVHLSEILGSKTYHDMASHLTVALGKDIAGNPVVADLARMPHLLVAGTTGSGKSVGINAMILSLLYKSGPDTVRLIMVDPKMLELSVYEGIPHLLAPVVTDMRQAASALHWCVGEMDRRYKLMSAMGVRNLAGYNQKIRDAKKAGKPLTHPFSLTPDNPEPLESMPHIVVVIDELADLMMVVGKKVEELIARLAQKARAAGIHLILATQRPSVDVITGLIKANIPTRIAFQVSSKIDSRTILDQQGAEALLGQGDMLYLPPGIGLPSRVHGAFVSDGEVHRVVDYLKALGEPEYIDGILESPEEAGGGLEGEGGADAESDPLYDQAVDIVLKTRRASISAVQRHLRIGYNRAARLIEAMEKAGLVSAMQSNGNREVIAPKPEN